jgi:hypothetical protein
MQAFLISSESSNAHRVMSLASWKVPGSSSGRSAHLAKGRESCSLVLESAEGSSQAASTNPALVPVRFRFIRKSEATLTPFCFMATIARTPAKEAAAATSIATFSFTDHSA